MNKAELIKKVATAADLKQETAAKAVSAVFDAITAELVSGEKVSVMGFGTFEVRERAERDGHNPQTGETIKIAASKVPGFKAGKALKDAVDAK